MRRPGAPLCAAQPALADGTVVRVGGTGIALAAMQQVGASLTAAEPGIRVEVLPSMGTPGGIKALAEGAIDVAVVARALKPDEKAKGVGGSGVLDHRPGLRLVAQGGSRHHEGAIA